MSRKKYDALWKGAVEDFFPEFLHFFFPELIDQIDFSRGFMFMDKEIADIYLSEEMKHAKFVDKLIGVYLRSGEELWFLIHLEVQGYDQQVFPSRMFRFFYRLRDKYRRDVLSMAIYLDKRRPGNAAPYVYQYNGTHLSFDYKRYYIGDQDLSVLQKSDNPFALIIQTAYIALQKVKEIKLYDIKLDLVKHLFTSGLPKEKIKNLLEFINLYLPFKTREINIKFVEEINSLTTTKESSMGILEISREIAFEEGMEAGIEKGLGQGINLTAENLLKKGVDINIISECTGLSIDKLLQIAL